ncbi:MAG TPA: tetratricopeptide repeat protein [Syntrophales bacterium]|nr:tetratricopeptide repeat protein [Syntrophales bacterium]
MQRERVFFFAGLFLFFSLALNSPVLCEEGTLFQEGVRQYYAENYEEAIEIFQKLQAKGSGSSQVSFFLGMSYKQAGDFEEALPPLRESLTLQPPVKEAAVELAEVLYRLDNLPEAKKWLAQSEAYNTFPAKTAFLKGTILIKEENIPEGIEALEGAKRLDASYGQIVDYHIGIAHLANRDYDKAKERLNAVVAQDPLSDLASFARRYQDIIEERRQLERPLMLTLGILGQYDTNMLQEPDASDIPDLGKESSLVMQTSFRMDYLPVFSGNGLFNAGFAIGNSLHEKNSTTYDTLTGTFYAAPGYKFGRLAVNLSTNYTHTLKRDPSYKRYYEAYTVGPLFRFLLSQNQIIEAYGAYAKDSYCIDPGLPEEDQDNSGIEGYLGWTRLFQNGGMANFKYGYSDKDADGENWSNRGHRFTANMIFPLRKTIQGQLGGDAFLQRYKNTHTIYDKTRKDQTYSALAGLIWDVHKSVSLNALYNYVHVKSNIDLYDYTQHLYTVGLELKF